MAVLMAPTKMRWSVEQRLEFIEFRLFWDGQLNRADLTEKFEISVPQASMDLSRYQSLAPLNIRYDNRLKTYLATAQFKPVVSSPTARYYLSQLRSIADEVLPAEETWMGWIPSFEIVPLVRRQLNVEVLRSAIDAIRRHLSIRVNYQSFSQPRPLWRWLTPHALGFDGFRWHVRAWCHEHEDFRDFVLARFLAVGESRAESIDLSTDREWHTKVTLRIGPHPKMKDGQRRAIERDFGMTNGVATIVSRVCLSYYVERQLALDLDPKYVPLERQQVVLLNRAEVEKVRMELRGDRKDTYGERDRYVRAE
jgi:WYL domain-containing protein